MALQIRSNVPAPQPSMIHRRKKMGWTRPGEGIIARSFREEANRGPAPGGPLRIDVGALSPLPWAWRPFSIIFLVFFTPWIQRKHTARHVTSSPGVRDSLPRPRTTSRNDQELYADKEQLHKQCPDSSSKTIKPRRKVLQKTPERRRLPLVNTKCLLLTK